MTAIRLNLSHEGHFLDQASVSLLKSRKREYILLPHRDVFGAVTQRKFFPCVIAGVSYNADVVTGSLYDQKTGQCATSKQMRVVTGAAAKTVKPIRKPRQGTVWQRTEKEAA